MSLQQSIYSHSDIPTESCNLATWGKLHVDLSSILQHKTLEIILSQFWFRLGRLSFPLYYNKSSFGSSICNLAHLTNQWNWFTRGKIVADDDGSFISKEKWHKREMNIRLSHDVNIYIVPFTYYYTYLLVIKSFILTS